MTETDLPNGWNWWSGERSGNYYTYWFGTEYQMGGALAGKHGLGGYEGEVYWDEGGEHHVRIYAIESIDENGDPIMSYPVISRRFDSEENAKESVPGLIEELKE